MPVQGITGAAEPVLGFNYGAKELGRVRQGIRFISGCALVYAFFVWGMIKLIPGPMIRIFNNEEALVKVAVPALGLYFSTFFMMALQFAGQSTFVSLGKSRQAVFFSIFRKVIIVVPLTILLPKLRYFGVDGVFWAEAISNVIGGIACYGTMYWTVYRPLGRQQKQT